jgi:hypothetical protein
MRVHHVERVAAAGEIHVVPGIARNHPVVGEIVDAAERQRGARVIAFGRVVVHHVQDHFDAGVVQILDHLLELADHIAGILRIGGVARVRGEKTQGVVAPIIAQALVDEVAIVQKIMHRHQFERGDAQALQMLDDGSDAMPA